MKSGFALGFVYVAALGAIATGSAGDVWGDELDAPLLLLAIAVGLVVFTIRALRKD